MAAVVLDQETDYREVVALICRRLGLQPLCVDEADRLEFLATHTGQVISRAQIIDGAWGGVAEATDAAVVSSVYRLRRKLHEAGATVRIATLPGQGYRLLLDAGAAPADGGAPGQ